MLGLAASLAGGAIQAGLHLPRQDKVYPEKEFFHFVMKRNLGEISFSQTRVSPFFGEISPKYYGETKRKEIKVIGPFMCLL